MNTNNNVYTVIYTTVIVVIVAALLAFVSQSLARQFRLRLDNLHHFHSSMRMTDATVHRYRKFQ